MYLQINRSLEYAFMALIHMSLEKNKRVSVKEMVKKLHCPFDPFSKVMQKLLDHHLIQSKKGKGGGYSFSGDLEKISVYKLMSAVLPSTEIVRCISGDCNLLSSCNIRTPIIRLNDQLIDFYKGISVQNLLQDDSLENLKNINNN